MPRPRVDPALRFDAKVARSGPDECWPWLAGKFPQTGYGAFHPEHGLTVYAHRFAYQLWVGPIPDGLVVDHSCRRRDCCNPRHLEPVTNEENLRRGLGYRLTNGMTDQCRRGHKYTPENTYYAPSKPHIPRCRECGRIIDRKRVRNVG